MSSETGLQSIEEGVFKMLSLRRRREKLKRELNSVNLKIEELKSNPRLMTVIGELDRIQRIENEAGQAEDLERAPTLKEKPSKKRKVGNLKDDREGVVSEGIPVEVARVASIDGSGHREPRLGHAEELQSVSSGGSRARLEATISKKEAKKSEKDAAKDEVQGRRK
jgi:hypothetical protein